MKNTVRNVGSFVLVAALALATVDAHAQHAGNGSPTGGGGGGSRNTPGLTGTRTATSRPIIDPRRLLTTGSSARTSRTPSASGPRPRAIANAALHRRPASANQTLRSVGSNRWSLGAGARPLQLNRTAVRNVLSGAQDDDSAARPHGVFDAGRRGALGVVAEAWDRAQRGGAGVATTSGRNGNTVFTVDMGRRVGFIGGREGARAGRPETSQVRIVVNRSGMLLTAYPTLSAGASAISRAAWLAATMRTANGPDMIGAGPSGGIELPDVSGPRTRVDVAQASAGMPAQLEIDDRSLSLLDRQLADDTSIDRSHGVFDGGRDGALGSVHEAWERVRGADASVTSRPGRSEGATIYRVTLGREVGFVGGARGAQQANPRTSSLELVVRRGRLMSAYPVGSRAASARGGAGGSRTPLGRGAVQTNTERPAANVLAMATGGGNTTRNESATPEVGSGGPPATPEPTLGELEIPERAMAGIIARAVDDPESDRFHTVFDGGRDGAVATVREAWERVRAGGGDLETRPGREAGTTIYRINLGREVGFIGGRDGRAQGNPKANAIDIVARGARLVAAYPVRQTVAMGERLRLEGRTLRIPSRPASGAELVTGRTNERTHPDRQLTTEQLRDRLVARARTAANSPIQPGRAEGGAQHLAYIGLPSDVDGDGGATDRLIVSRDTVISYNAERRVLNWEAWTMSEDTMGDAPRTDTIRRGGAAWERARVSGLDPRLPRDMPQADNDDYARSGYHRGHIRDSGAYTRTTAMNARTYTLTNAVPQLPGSNLGAWNGFEQYIRHMARQGTVVNVVSGPLFRGEVRTIGERQINVPTALWKIAIINPRGVAPGTINGNTRIISAIFPNTRGEARTDQDWTEFRTTPRVIEQQTGLRFFTNLPQAQAEHLRDGADTQSIPQELRLLRSHGGSASPGAIDRPQARR